MAEDRNAQEAVENVDKSVQTQDRPAAGPHARKDLTDMEKTPGTGALPDDDGKDADVGSD
ncbi:hypothetical protein EPK99_09760 [Neorhizobium lilium]|uniref:Uncharacterized protein n=1 Tax=Neorhizobium lilium TaxID=2503024 RepID=A0A3S3VKN1_9HYPH|nr:hypothetical protein [Neorhizobium lilium]RWX78855.1 hypothetical protein EPK99_09760 [Neorhizobium lilium]